MKLTLLLLMVGLAAQEPQIGAPPDGPFAFKEGHLCWKQPDQTYNGKTFHECHCVVVACIDGEPAGGHNCVTYCGTKQCVCHADEPCDMDQDPQSPSSVHMRHTSPKE